MRLKNKEADVVNLFIYLIQKFICDRPQIGPLLVLNTAAFEAATIQNNGTDHFL